MKIRGERKKEIPWCNNKVQAVVREKVDTKGTKGKSG